MAGPSGREGENRHQTEGEIMSEEKDFTEMPALGRSLDDAEVLVAYVVRNNVSGVQDAIAGVAEGREVYDRGELRGEAQRKFYVSFAQLAARVSPITVGTLKSCLGEYGPGRRTWFGLGPRVQCSFAQRAAKHYRTWAMVALVLLLFVQSYWLIGSNLLAAVPKLTAADRATLATSKVKAELSARAEAEQIRKTELAHLKADQARTQSQAKVDMTPEPSAKIEATPAPAFTKDELAERVALEAAIQLSEDRYNLSRMLAKWCRVHHLLVPASKETDRYSVTEEDPDRIIVLASRILEVLQQYVLPLLYGWLGAMAYVLRTLGKQARDRLYSVEDQINYNLRVWLGIVAGLAIGWFFRSDKGEVTAAVGSISSLALAFVAGYSVDLLFTAMDRIVAAFSNPEKTIDQTEAQPAVK
jgi:hypothetical protein